MAGGKEAGCFKRSEQEKAGCLGQGEKKTGQLMHNGESGYLVMKAK